jgi:hypothetical protein
MKFLVPDEQRDSAGVYLIEVEGVAMPYIGATRCFGSRYKTHLSQLSGGTHNNSRLQILANQHGVQNMVFKLLESIDTGSVNLSKMEQKWIDYYGFDNLLNCARVAVIADIDIRPKSVLEDLSARISSVTWDSLAQKQEAQAHAKRMGRSLAAHLKYLFQKDMEANPKSQPS